MANSERYNLLHDEVMRRLENGEITTEQANEVHDKIFDRYVIESEESQEPKNEYDEKRSILSDFQTNTNTLIMNTLCDYENIMTSVQKQKYEKMKNEYHMIVTDICNDDDTNNEAYKQICDNFHNKVVRFIATMEGRKKYLQSKAK